MQFSVHTLVLLVCALAACAARADDAPRPVISNLKALLHAAIDSPDGSARAILRTQETEAIGRHFRAASPLYADVDTERVYAQNGCRRLRLTLHYKAAILPGVDVARPHTMVYGFNYCRDGRPPRSLALRGAQP